VFGTAAVLLSVGCGGSSPVSSAMSPDVSTALAKGQDSNVLVPDTTLPQESGKAHTNHLILNGKSKVQPAAFSGWSPAQMRTCYGITGSGSGTIVIVDAFNDSTALADFNQFSTQYGLPTETSTDVTLASNQHLQVVYQGGRKPRNNTGWSQEESLDIEWSHAMAPNAKIVLVECASNSNANLYAGDDLAATISGAHQCSNSWSGGESSGEASGDSHFIHSGVVYFFSGGDTGGARGYPSESANVVGVGGTSVTLNANGTRANETAWTGTGCGPSAFIGIPSFQAGLSDGVHRGDDDVSAVADPNTGVSVRWNGGWYIFGGTSVSCPMIAGMVNDSGTNRASSVAENVQIYSNMSSFFDVTSGTAGAFSAHAGWDYPTGVGTPNGVAGF